MQEAIISQISSTSASAKSAYSGRVTTRSDALSVSSGASMGMSSVSSTDSSTVRAGLGDLAREVVECAGVGVTTSDYSLLKFEKVRRPVFPLDNI